MALGALDIIVLISILILNVLVGIAWSKKASKSTDDFYLAGRSLPWWLVGTSMVATTFALDTPLVIAEYIINAGLFQNWLWISLALSHVFVTFMLASFWRRSGAMTDVELCELRYSGKAAAFLRGFKSLFSAIVLNTFVLSVVFLAVRMICRGFGYEDTQLMGWALSDVLLVGGLMLTLAYSATAGLWGVVTTDAFQFALALGGAVLVAYLGLSHEKVGGFEGLRVKLADISIEREIDRDLIEFFEPVRQQTGASQIESVRESPLSLMPNGIGRAGSGQSRVEVGAYSFDDSGLLLIVFFTIFWWAWKNSDGGGVLIQRILAAKNEEHAVKGMLWFCFCHYVLRWWPWAIAGLTALVIFDGQSLNGSEAYARLVSEVVPLGLRGFILAYFLAAFMSTVDTHLQLAGSYVVNDFYKRFIKPEASSKHYINVGRIATVIILVLAFIGSKYWDNFKQVYVFLMNLVAGAGLVFLLRWFWWRINAWTEITALASSLIFAGGLFISNIMGWTAIPSWAVTVINVTGSTIIWLLATYLTRPTDEKVLEKFYRDVRPLGFWKVVANKNEDLQLSPFPSRAIICWLLIVLSIYSSLYAIRGFLAGDWGPSTVIIVVIIPVTWWVLRQISTILKSHGVASPQSTS
jgi:solute:Na+ symporter, SSS family